jgi:hypothetical protein
MWYMWIHQVVLLFRRVFIPHRPPSNYYCATTGVLNNFIIKAINKSAVSLQFEFFGKLVSVPSSSTPGGLVEWYPTYRLLPNQHKGLFNKLSLRTADYKTDNIKLVGKWVGFFSNIPRMDFAIHLYRLLFLPAFAHYGQWYRSKKPQYQLGI